MNLLEHVRQTIATHRLLRRGERALVAVSGGVDSMVLLRVLQQLAADQGWRLVVAHYNHRLRGASSDADARLVEAEAKRLGLRFLAGRADVRAFAARKKISLEMAARELRHEFLARTARRLKATRVVLAHHADDQVELFLLRLLRGSGAEGLAGMKRISPSPAIAGISLVRPLLEVRRSVLEQFAREHSVAYREDASNRSRDILRNRIRLELLPLLRREYSAALDTTVLRTMEIVGAEGELVAQLSRGRAGLEKKFSALPMAVQRRRVHDQLCKADIDPTFELVEWLRQHPGKPVVVDEKRNVRLLVSGQLRVAPNQHHDFLPGQLRLNLAKRGKTEFGGAKLRWVIERQARFVRPKSVAGREYFDADAVGGPVTLRHWQAGDRFQPIGMARAVKLQDLFVNAKISRERRASLVVAVTRQKEVFWVEGLRIGERFKLSPGTKRRLAWYWHR